jgi:micrococcal nuclease
MVISTHENTTSFHHIFSHSTLFNLCTIMGFGIIDGDTIKVELKGQKESVRLIGIDTPESKANKKALKDAARSYQDVKTITAMGKESTAFVKTLLQKGDTVGIEFDVQPRDRYGRLLAYVYLSDRRMLNDEIIKAGYAVPMTIPPNVKYQRIFLGDYREAKKNNKGLWAN